MEKTQGLEEHCNKQLAKIERFLENERSPISLDLILEPGKSHGHHKVELRVNTPHYHKISTHERPKFYEVLDHVIDVMYRELHEEKKKMHEHWNDINRHEEVKKAK
jgi:ribosomal subunit interface protein